VRRTAGPPLHLYDLICFGAMAAVGVGVVLNMGFLQRSDMLGLGDVAGRMVLLSVLAGLAAPAAVLTANLVHKIKPVVFFVALAAGATVYLGEAIAFRLMLPDALN
jgi:hypothetical protein